MLTRTWLYSEHGWEDLKMEFKYHSNVGDIYIYIYYHGGLQRIREVDQLNAYFNVA